MKLNAKAFALGAGIFWGVFLTVMTLISLWTGGYGASMLNLIKEIYIGYQISYTGALIGLLYGFVDGLVGCYIFAWLYNLLAEKLKK